MYYSFFLIYLAFGFAITFSIFLWALTNGQFRDQERARYIPLQEEAEKAPLEVSRFSRYQSYGLFAFLLTGLVASVAVLLSALW
jgi:cbb3-type cytochrome oxidase maturation protein